MCFRTYFRHNTSHSFLAQLSFLSVHSLCTLSSLFSISLYLPISVSQLPLLFPSIQYLSLSFSLSLSAHPPLSHSLSLSTLSSLSPPLSIEEDNNEIPRIESHTWNGSNVQGWKTPFYSLSPLSACPLYQ